mmetsp:Transcript_45571/g.105703  ORF Transcript_45571/g.105703 Transcript_45571/m.105703 type:complete len:883 (+) Transcript_45571:80-2728(+)
MARHDEGSNPTTVPPPQQRSRLAMCMAGFHRPKVAPLDEASLTAVPCDVAPSSPSSPRRRVSQTTMFSLSSMSKAISQQLTHVTMGDEISWQWEHKSGFRSYGDFESRRIEEAYMNGFDCFRLKTGKTGKTPMELFFVDMIQHDPITGNTRRIRRVGREGLFRWLQRRQYRVRRFLLNGRWARRDFKHYNSLRRKMATRLTSRSSSTFSIYSKKDSVAARIASSHLFQFSSMVIVFLNTVWIAVQADLADRSKVGFDSTPWVIDCAFCFAFLLELSVRYAAYQRNLDCLQDRWFCFDALLVVIMVIETWILAAVILVVTDGDGGDGSSSGLSVVRIVRLIRLVRLGRIAALVRLVPEALTLLKGIMWATRSVFVTMLLLFCLLFLFGVVFRMQVGGNAELDEIIPSVAEAMLLLLLHGTLLDSPAKSAEDIGRHSDFLVLAFLVFIFLSSFTVLNMLIGILCGVISTVTATEKEQAEVQYLRGTMLELLECYDQNEDKTISQEEFEVLMSNPEVHLILSSFGVDVDDLLALKKRLFKESMIGFFRADAEEMEGGEDVLTYDLAVTVEGVRDLRYGAADGLSLDLYCVVDVPGQGLSFRTQVIRSSAHPTWNFSGVLHGFHDGEAVRFTVYDRTWCRKDDFVGRVSLLSKHFYPSGYEDELTLIAPAKHTSLSAGRTRGKVRARIEIVSGTIRRVYGEHSSPSLSFAQILEVLLRLRRSKIATVCDVTELRHVLVSGFNKLYATLGLSEDAYANAGTTPRGSPANASEKADPRIQLQAKFLDVLSNHRLLHQQLQDIAHVRQRQQEQLHQQVTDLQSQLAQVSEVLSKAPPPSGADSTALPPSGSPPVLTPSPEPDEPVRQAAVCHSLTKDMLERGDDSRYLM